MKLHFNEIPAALTCKSLLARIDLTYNFHEQHRCRHPLALYNISTNKIIQRLKKFIDTSMEISTCSSLDQMSANIHTRCSEEIELVLYASAEHVDDVRLILDTFHAPNATNKSKAELRHYIERLKQAKDQITQLANYLKHNHGRIRIFANEFAVGNEVLILGGFCCEGYFDGGLGPSPHFHKELGEIVSFSAFAWEHLLFMWDVSALLSDYLEKYAKLTEQSDLSDDCDSYIRLTVDVLKLPLFSFDKRHPINGRKIRIYDKQDDPRNITDLLGSITRPWNNLELRDAKHGSSVMCFESDGVTKKFHLAFPKNLSLIHWEDFN